MDNNDEVNAIEFPAWVPCPDCDEYFCTIHEVHACECECPPIDEWGEVDPYEQGGCEI